MTSTVRDLVAGSGIEFEERGHHSLKGVPGRVDPAEGPAGLGERPRARQFGLPPTAGPVRESGAQRHSARGRRDTAMSARPSAWINPKVRPP